MMGLSNSSKSSGHCAVEANLERPAKHCGLFFFYHDSGQGDNKETQPIAKFSTGHNLLGMHILLIN